jgi:hypothetical protein
MTYVFPGPFDARLARAAADRALANIDWSSHDIVVWVPGTDNRTFKPAFLEGVRKAWSTGGMTAVALDYQANWHLDTSEPTGAEALRLLLLGIAAHGGSHRLLLAGESQGGWIVGDLLADPKYRRLVARATLLGHPSTALHHYDDGHDTGIREWTHPGDLVSTPFHGSRTDVLAAMQALHTGEILPNLGSIVRAMVNNPLLGVHALINTLRDKKILPADPHDKHNYDMEFADAATFLHADAASSGAR